MQFLKLIPTNQFKSHYQKIRDGLIYLHENTGGSYPEEVYAECSEGRAFLLLCEEGFVIVTESEDELAEKRLFIWCAYSRLKTPVFHTHIEDLKDLAKEIGASSIAFRTERVGFSRLLPPEWKVGFIEYELEVH